MRLPDFAGTGDRRTIDMKKALLFGVAWGLVAAGFVFGADSYSVQGVAGPVYRLGSAGQWIAVSEGDTLSPSTIIRIGLNAALVVKDGDGEQILRSVRQGALESFLGAGAAGAEGRVSVGGRAVDSPVSPAVSGASPPDLSSAGMLVRDRELDWAE
jgi:hypothetical protein